MFDKKQDSPAGIYGLARRALPEFLKRRRAIVAQVVARRRGDDRVPNDSLVGRILGGSTGGGPLGGHIDEHLLGVPGKKRAQVGVEAKLDDAVLFLFGGVVVGPALDDLDICGFEGSRRFTVSEEIGGGDKSCDDEGDGGEEAECVLEANDGGVHRGGWSRGGAPSGPD